MCARARVCVYQYPLCCVALRCVCVCVCAGKVFYRLDLNWKRYDIYNESGVLRALGQVPCDEPDQEEDTAFGCLKDGEKKNVSTVLHRGSQMYFLDWNEDASKVTKCSWMDLQIIGNIRPDWFMDK